MKTGLTQAQRKEQTRTSLVATARRVFLERGFHASRLDDIADAAGYSKGAVYSNFASKADLLFQIQQRRFEALLLEQERTAAAPGRASERLHRLLAGHLAFFERQPN